MVQRGYYPSGSPSDAVKWPATLLLVVGVFYVVAGLGSVVIAVGGVASSGQPITDSGSYSEAQLVYGLISGSLMFILGIPVLYGAIMMKKLERFGMAMIGAICAMAPCSCCFMVGLPIGIWALVVLQRPEVKGAFRV
jgi:hypothetical protein